MTKYEFLKGLREALEGSISESQINENISYYERYITDEIIKGRNETDVVEELGNPRLIAKTIAETATPEKSETKKYREPENYGTNRNNSTEHTTKIHGWLARIIGILIAILGVIVIVAIVSGILWLLFSVVLPIVIVAIIVAFIVRLFKK